MCQERPPGIKVKRLCRITKALPANYVSTKRLNLKMLLYLFVYLCLLQKELLNVETVQHTSNGAIVTAGKDVSLENYSPKLDRSKRNVSYFYFLSLSG